ncbi:hypothetical protein NLM24_26750 [Nocardia zapadnayensis]|uniref:hypothetical protein n=1 Tax=Nocardia rhamnosiphila TaxID=426716 RepID=UPI002247DF4F|nr:hypothetical protein [Nocardia zapadnayensis]MCX0274225.1 hypothetical protein [Nocardia zapadnayensis]
MKRLALASAAVVVAGFISAVLLLVAADAKLDERKAALLASHCARHIDVPMAAMVFNWSATILLLVAGIAAIVFIVSVFRFGAVLLKVSATIVAGVAFVITVGYALLVGAALVDPSAEEPISPAYHPCAGRF